MQDATAIIARQLAQENQAKRIYKLLIYAGEGTWLGEISTPNEATLSVAVHQMLQKFPDYGQLRSYLYSSVNSLSKPAEYAEIADIILDTISQACGDCEDPTTTFLSVPPKPLSPPSLYSPIADRLSALPNQIRLKKLTFCVAQSVWEGDAQKLEALTWSDLIASLYQRYVSREDLYKAFQHVVTRLSKPIEYSILAETVMEELAPLYQKVLSETPASFIPDALESAALPVISSPLPDQQSEEMISLAPWSEVSGSSVVEAIDSIIFDLHHDVMKQANPLRLKHLLLILVSNLEPDEAIDRMNLRQQTTIPLLSNAFRLHRKPEILAIKLREIARKLPDPEEYENTIDAIIRSFKARLNKQQATQDSASQNQPTTLIRSS